MRGRLLDPVSLVFGLFFAAVGALLVAGHADLLVQLRWAWPIVLIIVAALLLIWLAADRYRGSGAGGSQG